jgi:hypothetical protein
MLEVTMTFIKENCPVLAAMRSAGVEETRENYIYWAFGGDPPEGEIDPEIESTFPVQFRRDALDEPESEAIQ